MKILLVDDEYELVSALAERMSMRGINAEWVSSGKDALEKLHGTTYDLAVIDMKMPKMGGLELRKRIREIQPEMKYIFMTGHGSSDDFNAVSTEEGAYCYLVKPVKFDLLIEKINESLETLR